MTGHGWVGRILRRLAIGAAAILLASGLAIGASRTAPRPREEWPNYAIPNITGAVMCFVVLFIPCKRFRRT